ncbi:MAG: S41 family peptidase [Spirochaetia bacterium]
MKNRERTKWIAVTAFLAVFAGAVAFSPFLLFAEQKEDTQQYINRLQYAFDFILENYVEEVPAEELFEGAMEGLFESLDDPYSYYLTADDMSDMSDTTTGKFGGVGLYISRPADAEEAENEEELEDDSLLEREPDDERSKYIKVVAPIEDTPAFRAGIHAGDHITKVEDESTAELTVDEVVDRLRGTPGSDVTVTILRDKDITFEVTITRAVIEVPTVKHDMINDEIGYLRIIQFTPYTSEKVREAMEEFSEEDYTSLIIDVRGNPGGLLTAVTNTLDLFLPSGVMVSTKSRIPQENEIFEASSSSIVSEDLPITVLIDQGSASASEILAGAFKDTGRGTLIGTKTFGKGSVQKIIPFGQSGFKLTISRYFTPGNVNIDKVGIKPDIKVEEEELTDEDSDSLKHIFENSYIKNYVDENPEASEEEKREFIQSLQDKEEISIETTVLRKLLKNEYQRRMDFPPIYDLEYDKALQEAVEMLEENEVQPEFRPYDASTLENERKREEAKPKI